MTNSKASLATMQAEIEAALQQKKTNKGSEPKSASAMTAQPAAQGDMNELDAPSLSRVIEMAWEDRTPFAAIEHSYGLNEAAVIILMRQQLKPSSFRLWRRRVTGRTTKHQAKRGFDVGRAYCKTQYKPR